MASGINRGLMWLRRTLQITEETKSPSVLSEIVRPNMDVFGWDRMERLDHELVTVVGPAAVNVTGQPVPEDEMFLIMAAELFHNDTVTTQPMGMVMTSGGGPGGPGGIFVTDTVDTAANFRVTLKRPLLIPPGGNLSGNALLPGIGATFTFFLEYLFVRLDVGEYIPASPYG